MIRGDTGLPGPTFGDDDIVVGFEEIPRIVAVMPCTTTDEAVALTIMHLAGKAVGIGAVVSIIVAVMVRVAINDIIIGAIGSIVLRNTRERITELMSEAQLQARIQVIRKLTAFYAVMRPFQFDAIVGRMGNMQAKQPPVVPRNGDATFPHPFVSQSVHEVENRLFTVIATNQDRVLCCTTALHTNSELAIALHRLFIRSTTTDDVGAWLRVINGFLQIEPRFFYRTIACLIITIGSNINSLLCRGECFGGNPCTLGDIRRIIRVNRNDICRLDNHLRHIGIAGTANKAEAHVGLSVKGGLGTV